MIPCTVDFETYYSKKDNVSAGTIGLPNYVKESYAYIVAVVGQDVKWVGSIEDAQKKFPPAWLQDPQKVFWAANSNFDQACHERYFGPTARPWKCLLERSAVQQHTPNLTGV